MQPDNVRETQYPGIYVDADGNVFRKRGDGLVPAKPIQALGPYQMIRAGTRDGRPIVVSVGKLVALAYVGPSPDPSYVVRHRNGDKSDCRASNLVWGSRVEPLSDKQKQRAQGRERIQELLRQGRTVDQVVAELGVKRNRVYVARTKLQKATNE